MCIINCMWAHSSKSAFARSTSFKGFKHSKSIGHSKTMKGFKTGLRLAKRIKSDF